MRQVIRDLFEGVEDNARLSDPVVMGKITLPSLDDLSTKLGVPEGENLDTYVTAAEAQIISRKLGINLQSAGEHKVKEKRTGRRRG